VMRRNSRVRATVARIGALLSVLAHASCLVAIRPGSASDPVLAALAAVPVDSLCTRCEVALVDPSISHGTPSEVTGISTLGRPLGAVVREGRVPLMVGLPAYPSNADTAAFQVYVQPRGTDSQVTILVTYRAPQSRYLDAAIWVQLRRTQRGWQPVSRTVAHSQF
jgi:hypothetical protein